MAIAVEAYQNLDLGSSKPTAVPMETIHATISSENLLAPYGKAFVNECYRVNPLKAEQVKLTGEEMEQYSKFLLDRRVRAVLGTCDDFRKLKSLYIPSWIQYNLSMIGEVIMRDRGLRILPELEETDIITFDQALAISEKIGSFEDDLQIVKDAMPRSTEGNKDVMMTAVIAGYVRSIDKVEHVSSTYVSAFLGMKLKEEMAMQVLYRVQYDDVAFIAAALMTQKGLFT
jgi:hypothetical protein